MASRATSSKATATVARRALAAFPLNPGRAAAAITPTRTSSSSSSPARLARLAVSPPRRRPRAAELDRWSAVQSFFLQQAAVTSSSSSSTLPASRRGDGRLALRAYASMPSSPSGDNSSSSASAANTDTSTSSSSSHPTPPPHPPLRPHPTRTALLSTYPTSLRRLASQLDPSSDPHARPTKSELLRLTDSWLDRLRIRWKWLTIRGFRRFNADEWSAVASWALVANLGWLVIGTTTFFSAVLLTAKVLNLQDSVARALSNYFTEGSGVTVIFESAIVPKFFQSTISLRNVFVSRRPKSTYYLEDPYASTSTESASRLIDSIERGNAQEPEEEVEDTNYSMFDLQVDSIDVTLSFVSWLNGEGLVKKAAVKGVRGVIDRRSVTWDPSNPWIPAEWRHPVQPGDGSFNLDSLSIEDFLCTVYQPGDFRPYNVSIFRAEFGQFRKKWLFYDWLSADSITGQYDNCLFSLHKPQKIGKTTSADEHDGSRQRMARLRIDGLPIDHLQGSSASGPLAWITSGKLDGVVDITFPRHPSEDVTVSSVLSEIIGNVAEIASPAPPSPPADPVTEQRRSKRDTINPGTRPLGKPALVAPEEEAAFFTGNHSGVEEEEREVVMDIDLRFRDLKAAVPFRTEELSYVNSALIRPIVAFINANRTLLPIRCRVVQPLSEFDGSWTPFETGLLDACSNQVYSALAHHVTSQAANTQRMKAVGAWSLQLTAEAVVGALRGAVTGGTDRFGVGIMG